MKDANVPMAKRVKTTTSRESIQTMRGFIPVHPGGIHPDGKLPAMAPPVQVSLLNYFVNSFPVPYRFPRHQHVEHEIILVDNRPYSCRLNGHALELAPGTILVVGPGDWHEDLFSPPLRCHVLQLRLAHWGTGAKCRLLAAGISPQDHCLGPSPQEWFRPFLDKLEAETQDKIRDFASIAVQVAVAEELFWQIVRRIPRRLLSPEFAAVVSHAPLLQRRLSRLFEESLHGNLTVGAMAHALGMSVSALAHDCRRELGIAPASAFTEYKVRRAAEMLRHTEMSLKEIGEYLGFKNPYHFSRVFRSVQGVPPAAYKAMSRETLVDAPTEGRE
jgi:AraC-like DNA-binding protein